MTKRFGITLAFLCLWYTAYSQVAYLAPSNLPDLVECLPAPPEKGSPNRMILRDAMLRHGFKPLDSEWWHFTLKNEPFPDTYFNFPVY